jgi:hypothetical protein
VQLSRILLVHTRHAHHPPDAALAVMMAREQRQHAPQIEAIRASA